MVRVLSARFSLELTTLFPFRQFFSLLLDRCPSDCTSASTLRLKAFSASLNKGPAIYAFTYISYINIVAKELSTKRLYCLKLHLLILSLAANWYEMQHLFSTRDEFGHNVNGW
jgi:hypothetical protein